MEENKQHIDDLFREALGNYTESPPPAVWEVIERRLANDERRKPGFMAWWGWVALMLLIAGGSALGYQYWKNKRDTQHETLAAATIKTNTSPAITTANSTGKDTTPLNSSKKNPESINARAETNDIKTGGISHQFNNEHSRHILSSSARMPAPAFHHKEIAGKRNNSGRVNKNNSTEAATAGASGVNDAGKRQPALSRNNRLRRPTGTVTASDDAHPKGVAVQKGKSGRSTTARIERSQITTVGVAGKQHLNGGSQDLSSFAGNTSSRSSRKQAQESNPAKRLAKRSAARKDYKPEKAVESSSNVATANRYDADNNSLNSTQPPRRKATQKTVVAKAVKTKTRNEPQVVTTAVKSRPIRNQKALKAFTSKDPVEKRRSRNTTSGGLAKTSTPAHTEAYNALPASLQGKDENVRFPTARVPDKKPETTEKHIAVTAPDASTNPVTETDSDTSGEAAPYTMNKQRKAPGSGLVVGLAAGYSFGFAKPAPGEVIISPYIQTGLTSRLSLRFSPSYRFGNVSSQAGNGSSYHINSNSAQHTIRIDSLGGAIDTFHNYHISQNFDSVIVSSSYGGKTWAIDLPITLAYKLGAGFSLFGGPVFSYQNTISSSSSRQTFNITRMDSVINSTTPIDSVSLINRFEHSGSPTAAANDDYAGSPAFRIGYLAGLRFNKGRWQAELSLQQNLSGLSGITNETIRKIYAQPYFRITIGYDLWKPRRKKVQQP